MDGHTNKAIEPLLSCRGVSVDYVTAAGNARACNRITLDIHPGETVGLAGESGCGKSTLAFAITRMHNPPALISEGEILFEGRDVLKMKEEALRAFRWSETAMVFQSAMNALNPVITIGAQLTDEGFTSGAATAAYQIEGHKFGGAGTRHRDTFAATPGNVVRCEDGALACDHYNPWDQDLDLLKEVGSDAYRFSTSWARVMPDGQTLNHEGIDFYDRLVDGMTERGLDPVLTLYHWDLPSALAVRGGWTNRDTAERFADYAEVVLARPGNRVVRTATINEPWCVSWLSHYEGQHAPGLRDIRATARSMHHIQLAHGLGVQRLREARHKNLGVVLNFSEILPFKDGEERAVAIADALGNRWFIESIAHGTYPEEALEGLGPHMPENWQDDMAVISSPIDWLGLNYYSRNLVSAKPGAPWPGTQAHEGPLPKTQMGWEIYADGLRNLLERTAKDYVGDLPIIVTENGMTSGDEIVDGEVVDGVRMGYISGHLAAAREAIDRGVNLQGFFYWSLLDNYEWSFGYEKRFGLIYVDFETLERTPKESFWAFKAGLNA